MKKAMYDQLKNEAEECIKLCHYLLNKIDHNYSGDVWIERNISFLLKKSEEFVNFIKTFDALSLFEHVAIPHPLSEEKILIADGWQDSYVAEQVRLWRRNLGSYPYENLPTELRKEIFDYFFRNDLYGELNQSDITRLSQGVNDLNYFRPPAIVNIALEVASKNNWFGYSDSLGHINTRISISKLEQYRRNKIQIDIENTAVVQGGTAGLHAVLSMIHEINHKKICVVALPTYSPIFDDVARIFELKVLSLSINYEVNYEELFALASDKNVSAILFSIPHNPYGLKNLGKNLNILYTLCEQNSIFLVFDEIVFDPEISPFLNPLDCTNLILISSYSKTYNIPGLKLGHLLASKDFVRKFYRHASTTYGSPPSFLYLTATCITTLEHAFNSHFFDESLPTEVSDIVSSSNLVFGDFRIWRKFYFLNIKFQHLILDAYYKNIGHVGIDKLIGLDDPSPNIILRIKGNGSAYKDSLKILARRNVSVMPIECFSPPATWLRDVRVTVAVEPKTLVQGLTDLICAIDEIYSKETRNDWYPFRAAV